MGPLALRNAIAGLQWDRWHSGTPSRAYNGTAGAQECHRGPTMGSRWRSGTPFPGRNVAAGTQERHSRDGMSPLALRNANPATECRRWRSGTPFPGRNGSAGTQERHSRDGMSPLALRNAIPATEWGFPPDKPLLGRGWGGFFRGKSGQTSSGPPRGCFSARDCRPRGA